MIWARIWTYYSLTEENGPENLKIFFVYALFGTRFVAVACPNGVFVQVSKHQGFRGSPAMDKAPLEVASTGHGRVAF